MQVFYEEVRLKLALDVETLAAGVLQGAGDGFAVEGNGKPEDELMKMDALIRANLGMNTKGMDAMEYAEAYSEAMWIENFRLRNQAELLAAMFGGKKGKGLHTLII